MFEAEGRPDLLRDHRFIIGVFAVILDASKQVLLCHRNDMNLWNLPGGAMEQGETPWEAVGREVEEEVGLRVAIEQLLGIYARPDQNEVAFGFLCRPVGSCLRCTDEADCVEYFGLGRIPENTNHEQIEALQDVTLQKPQTLLKRQAGPSPREVYFGKYR